jgi:serine/threonine protein kinase
VVRSAGQGPGTFVSAELGDGALARLAGWDEAPPEAGERYTARELLGRGGMGQVWLAHDHRLGREVALKVIDAGGQDPAALAARLEREVQVQASLEHPGVVPIHDAGRLPDGRAFCVMKRIEGRRLDQVWAAEPCLEGRLAPLERVAETVAFAHDRGVVHRDLKPANVMVGSFGEVLVLDWGLAKRWREGAEEPPANADDAVRTALGGTAHGVALGTPGYMPPEQLEARAAKVAPSADVYALGALLHEAVAGQPPPGATARLAGASLDLRAAPRPLRALLERALALDPARRYPDAADFFRELQRYRRGERVRAHRESAPERMWRAVLRHRVAVGLVGAYLVMRAVLYVMGGR